MCKFCENHITLTTTFPKENQYGELDSSNMIMLSEGCIRIANPDGRTFRNNLPIFTIDVLYCPYCGKQLKEHTTLTKFQEKEIYNL